MSPTGDLHVAAIFIWGEFRFGVLAPGKRRTSEILGSSGFQHGKSKLTWLVLGGDPAVRSRKVEQFTAF